MVQFKSITQLMTGMALSSALFLGCQDFLSQKPEENSANTQDEMLQDVSLKLGIKDSAACLEMQGKIKTAHAKGTSLGSVDSAFARNCVKEIHDSGMGKPIHTVPENMIPDDKTRCHWIIGQIDGGREEMLIKLRFYCPDNCNPSKIHPSREKEKYCRDPKPDCFELKHKLAMLDENSEDHARLHHLIGDVCSDRPREDSLPPYPHHDSIPPEPEFDSLPPQPILPRPHGDSIPPKPIVNCLPPHPPVDGLRSETHHDSLLRIVPANQ